MDTWHSMCVFWAAPEKEMNRWRLEKLAYNFHHVCIPYGCPRNDYILLFRISGSAIFKKKKKKVVLEIFLLIHHVDYSSLFQKKPLREKKNKKIMSYIFVLKGLFLCD